MYNFLIFDLDDTLIPTIELAEFRGQANVNLESAAYQQSIIARIMLKQIHPSIPQDFLLGLKATKPELKFAVVTTAPRFYASTLLRHFYPRFTWDAIVGFEDVSQTKPNPEGLYLAYKRAGCDPSWKHNSFVMIGDSFKDVAASYRAGIRVILYTGCWPQPPGYDRFNAANLLPDANVKTIDSLREAIGAPQDRLPIFELVVEGGQIGNVRAPKILHFCHHPSEVLPNGKEPAVAVHTMGRLFTEHTGIFERRKWHIPTQQIHDNKDAVHFPATWITAIQKAIAKVTADSPGLIFGDQPLVVTCIPHKPGRTPRLEHLLLQLKQAHDLSGGRPYQFAPQALYYLPGARSHHGEHLGALARYENSRDFLRVTQPNLVDGKTVLVLDDVVTSGASLFYAEKYLKAAGAASVICLALTQTINPV